MERVSLRSFPWVVIGHTSAQIWYVQKWDRYLQGQPSGVCHRSLNPLQ